MTTATAQPDLLGLADVPFHMLLDQPDGTVLDDILQRLFDPDRDKFTISASGSAV